MNNKKGFTLIELLAVIVILGIVVAIAIPGINSVITTARANTFVQEVKLIADGARIQLVGEGFVLQGTSTIALPTANPIGIPIDQIATDKGGVKSAYNSNWDTSRSYVIAELGDDGSYEFKIAVQDAAGNRILLMDPNSITRGSIANTGTITAKAAGATQSSIAGLTGKTVHWAEKGN